MSRIAFFLVPALGLASCARRTPAPQDTERDSAIVEKAKRADLDMDKLRRATIVAAKTPIVPRADLGPCPIKWVPHLAPNMALEGDAATNTTYWNVARWDASDEKILGIVSPHMDDTIVAVERLGIAFADEVPDKPGPRHFAILSAADSRPLGARQRGELEKYVDPAYEPTDQQLVIDAEVDAKMTGDKEFEPGLLKGRFYVYDHTRREVVCAAHVLVKSSSDLWIRYRVEYDRRTHETKGDDKVAAAAEHLRGDLRQQALLAASESLFVAGPLEDAGATDGGPRDAGARDTGRDAK